ncbi:MULTISPECIES: glycogen synthase [Tenacibaculum]|uniref:glycogen synthase n=1 Tax=Tenacibaculum TaxID=104267 RepID=UPI001F0AF1F4|nr:MULTISPECIES: glycogen/starch synthase [Tenacibaculum]MCH3880995.1 glycogen synthase [Tenacibaculum aquimarinum]MDO6599405.1 glycogen/starch synthase [Tenacibaculum sp. 1_MG-2023]
MTKILHISAECYPVAKVGGLADVVGALPKYQNALGVESNVVMPFYDNKFTKEHSFKSIYKSKVVLGNEEHSFEVLTLDENSIDIQVFFIDVKSLLFKDYVYSFDDTDRFLAFQIAVLDWILTFSQKPNIIHCHDHHTGLIPFMLQESFKYKSLNKIPVVTTIHNAQYQGWFSYDKLHLIPKFDLDKIGLLDWNGIINPLAAAIKCAWTVTTVSQSYMEELKSSANGLESLLSQESQKCVGILNGVDTKVWNPETDPFLIEQYAISNNTSGKKANKKWLCKTFNLDEEKPLFAFIGRLVGEKGSDLFPEAFDLALQNNDISILLLGSGNTDTENKLQALKEKHVGNYNTHIGYDEKLSHKVYAGADFLLMPSRVEPCGLNQMYSLRYGTIPIVRSIGGLRDTIIDVSDNGFGFTHKDTSVDDICSSIKRATDYYSDKTVFRKNRTRIMKIDNSWDNSAKKYIELYKTLK